MMMIVMASKITNVIKADDKCASPQEQLMCYCREGRGRGNQFKLNLQVKKQALPTLDGRSNACQTCLSRLSGKLPVTTRTMSCLPLQVGIQVVRSKFETKVGIKIATPCPPFLSRSGSQVGENLGSSY